MLLDVNPLVRGLCYGAWLVIAELTSMVRCGGCEARFSGILFRKSSLRELFSTPLSPVP
jgi:hypothetical protein